MILLWLPIGLILPTLAGWFLMRILEGGTPVLGMAERIALSFLLGLTFTIFLMFLLQIAGLSFFTRLGIVSSQSAITVVLGTVALFLRSGNRASAIASQEQEEPLKNCQFVKCHGSILRPGSGQARLTMTCLRVFQRFQENFQPLQRKFSFVTGFLLLAALLTVLKIVVGGSILLSTPSFFDDTLKNWNLRGKAFVQHQAFTLAMDPYEPTAVGDLSSYPPTVSMVKATIATLAGEWNEPLVNGIHLFWFIALLLLLYGWLRRFASLPWAVFGVYLLASLPLVLFHGVNAYAEIFLAGHLFASVGLLVSGVAEEDASRRAAFFRLSAFATGLLVFTKNEALLLHLPVISITLAGSLWFVWKQSRMTPREIRNILAWYSGFFLLIALPWLMFKWSHGLTFGNAKAVGDMAIGWQPKAVSALLVNTFFEGNWHLLFPLFFLLLLFLRRSAFSRPLVPLIGFILLILGLQTGLFLFTSLSTEAVMQTGSSRGFLQVVPLVVLATVMLVRDVFERNDQ
ncbi:MAG: hypothetical protein WCG83_04620 [Candidatus Peregrinibacteria bacterium]